ncbi:hypothetical protein F2Q68_00040309 [Brassica cretica]|uniref:Uncharacterized protein n=1 Tax=Brassica cretica TaxID=69181 RepID=A0A8S9MHM4_BRACR|nr:hypothetical protein F2Q68_00040309 [Brassica cretica]
MDSLRSSGDSIEGQTRMHGLMSYRRFGKARSLRSDRALARARSLRSDRAGRMLGSDRAWLELGRYVATERNGRSVATFRPDSVHVRIRTKLYLGNIRCDVLVTEHDSLRKDILVFCGDLDVNFVVTVFDPNS